MNEIIFDFENENEKIDNYEMKIDTFDAIFSIERISISCDDIMVQIGHQIFGEHLTIVAEQIFAVFVIESGAIKGIESISWMIIFWTSPLTVFKTVSPRDRSGSIQSRSSPTNVNWLAAIVLVLLNFNIQKLINSLQKCKAFIPKTQKDSFFNSKKSFYCLEQNRTELKKSCSRTELNGTDA